MFSLFTISRVVPGSYHQVSLQAIFPVLSTTPWAKLSEPVLAEGLRQYVHLAKMVPEGITDSCLEAWAARQAFGLRRVCQKFRKIFAESPTSAKNKKIQDLKRRLLASGMEKREPRQLSAEELDEFPAPDFDWASVRAKIEELKRKKKSEAAETQASVQNGNQSGEAKVPEEIPEKRPVPTPSRGKYSLPPYVVKALEDMKGNAPKPFATTGEGDEPEPAEGATETFKKKGKATAKAKGKAKAKGQKKKKAELTGPEVEENLQPLGGDEAATEHHAEQSVPAVALAHPPPDLLQTCEAPTAGEASSSYCPKAFSKARLEYIAKRKQSGTTHKDACTAWMVSQERADLLPGLSEKELKRRRFIS